MDRAEVVHALRALGADLQRSGITADIYVVGGAAIALAYDERRSTRDIDAVFVPKIEVYLAAGRVGEALGLPEGWLNDAVKGFLLGPDPFDTEIIELPGLRCEVASAEMVLVLKCLAHRIGEDDEDVALLAGKAGLRSAPEVLDLVARVAPERLLTPQVRFFVEAVLDDA
ncbi:MAG: DUF6036 family nucleotidyltransferase [Pseudonocardia sp.]|nr:DUF6036 family nucleotidyltransferase [Pseudonocardia sp.]